MRASVWSTDLAAPRKALAHLLRDRGQLAEAEAEYREVIRRYPDDPEGFRELGFVLVDRKQNDAGLEMFRAAARRCGPGNYYWLGVHLERFGKPEEADAADREAVALDGGHIGAAIFSLGELYRRLGRYADATATYRRAADLARAEGRADEVDRADDGLRRVARQQALADCLPGLLSGADRPRDGAGLDEVIRLCHERRLLTTGARVCEVAFAAGPKLADDRDRPNRYNAACLAALAACGLGSDSPRPTAPRGPGSERWPSAGSSPSSPTGGNESGPRRSTAGPSAGPSTIGGPTRIWPDSERRSPWPNCPPLRRSNGGPSGPTSTPCGPRPAARIRERSRNSGVNHDGIVVSTAMAPRRGPVMPPPATPSSHPRGTAVR